MSETWFRSEIFAFIKGVRKIRNVAKVIFNDTWYKEHKMDISACNVVDGTVGAIHQGPTTSHVEIVIQGIKLVASMTNESVKSLNLKEGMPAQAVINAVDVLVLVK